MDFKELQHLLTCPICLIPYDKTIRSPVIVPCAAGHTVCAYCAQQIIAASQIARCPFDKEILFLRERDISCFRHSLDLRKFINHFSNFEFCIKHPLNIMDLLCLRCHVKICYKCDKKNHQGHSTESLGEIWKKAEEKQYRLRDCINHIDIIDVQWKLFLSKKEEEVIKNFKLKLNSYIEELMRKGDNLIEEVKTHFSALRTNLSIDERIKGASILKWKEEAAQELNSLDSEIWRTKDDKSIPYCIFDHEETMEGLKAEEWVRGKEETVEKFKTEAEKISLSFNEDYQKLLQQKPIGHLVTGEAVKDDLSFQNYNVELPRMDRIDKDYTFWLNSLARRAFSRNNPNASILGAGVGELISSK